MFKGIKINSVSTREFFFFLLLTTFFAALIKLSKTYPTQYEVAFAITDLPLDRTIQQITPPQIKVNAQGTGFSLLKNALDAPVIRVPFIELERITNKQFTYNTAENQLSIRDVINGELSIVSIIPSEVKINIDSVASKRVPVISKVDLSYKLGFGARNELVISPDSITVVGPSLSISEIFEVATIKKKITNISTNVADQVALSVEALPEGLKLSNKTVYLSQQITKFTEGKIVVPITVMNDINTQVKILPKTAEIIYLVELENFDSISPSDFLVTCDYSKATDGDAYLTLNITKKPESVKNARLINKQVKFIIVN